MTARSSQSLRHLLKRHADALLEQSSKLARKLFLLAQRRFNLPIGHLFKDTAKIADNLKNNGAYIPGIRPGTATADYLDYVLTRLTAVGALYLSSVCLLPELILAKVQLPFYFGGTSLLIVVSTTIETFSQLATRGYRAT